MKATLQSILHVPSDAVNPYNRLLAEALASHGIRCDLWRNPPRSRNPRKLLLRLRGADLVHWHWNHGFYAGRTVVGFAMRSALYASVLAELRLRGIPQVQTVHNLFPHEHTHARLHRGMFRVVGLAVDRLVVHSTDAVDPVAKLYGNRGKIRVVPHMDYGDPVASGSRPDYIRKWNLEAFPRWAIVFGGVRRYKRVELVLQAAKALADQGVGLVVAGCPDEAYSRELRAFCHHNSPRFILRRLEAEELSELLLASDAAVMPYSDSLTSGAAHLALSHDLPIVATDSLAFREMIRRGLVTVCNPEECCDLVSAVNRAFEMRRSEAWIRSVRAYRQGCSLAVVGRKLSEVYAEVLPGLWV